MGSENQARTCLNILPPVVRSDRPADAIGIAQGCIAHRLVERLAQFCGEIADPLACWRNIVEAVALPCDMGAGARLESVAGLAGQPSTDRIEGDMRNALTSSASSIATGLKRACHKRRLPARVR